MNRNRAALDAERRSLPMWVKVAYTVFFFPWIVEGYFAYGPANLLWLCNICNLLLIYGVWRESRIIFSSQLLAVLLTSAVWTIDVLTWALTGWFPLGFTGYMANPEIPLVARIFSLYHSVIPILLIFGVRRLGYDRRGLWLQVAITTVLLPVTLAVSPPEWNINWVWGPGFVQSWMPPWAWLALCVVGYPVVLYLPVHAVILAWRRRGRQ